MISAEAGPPVAEKATHSAAVADDQLWDAVVDNARRRSQSDAAKVDLLECLGCEDGTLRLRIRDDAGSTGAFLQRKPETIEAIVERATGRRVKVRFEAAGESAAASAPSHADYDSVRRLPLVQKALDLFDARIVDVQEQPASGRSDQSTQENPSNV